jgi:hypothetical protein
MTTVPSARVVKGGDVESSAGERDLAPPINVIALAPRTVPRAFVARLLFGGPLGAFGWVFAAFGMIFTLVFVPRSMPDFTSYDMTATATVEHVETTTMSENKEHVLRVTYTFEDAEGQLHRGQSYTRDPVETNSERTVEYTRADPDVSRLRGMRRSPFDSLALIVLVFPIAGIAIAWRQLVRGIRAVRVLRTGVETTGKIVDVTPTKLTVQNQRIMRATVEYLVGERTCRTTFDFPKNSAPALDGVQRLVYDPQSPTRATTLDNLPGQPRITEGGVLAWTPGSAALVLIAPVIFVLELVALPFVF